MKNLKKIFITSVIGTSAIAGGVTAFSQELASPGGYDFNHPLVSPNMASVDLEGNYVSVHNHLMEPNSVNYWHAWFWNDDMGRRTETTNIPSNYYQINQFVYFSAYANTGYAAVIQITTTHYFYYLEFNESSRLVSLTYNTYGGYPYFSAPHWTIGQAVEVNQGKDILNISQLDNDDLFINWTLNNSTADNFTWTLPW